MLKKIILSRHFEAAHVDAEQQEDGQTTTVEHLQMTTSSVLRQSATTEGGATIASAELTSADAERQTSAEEELKTWIEDGEAHWSTTEIAATVTAAVSCVPEAGAAADGGATEGSWGDGVPGKKCKKEAKNGLSPIFQYSSHAQYHVNTYLYLTCGCSCVGKGIIRFQYNDFFYFSHDLNVLSKF
jgi:hypothetical protein